GDFLDNYEEDLKAFAKKNKLTHFYGIKGGITGSLNSYISDEIIVTDMSAIEEATPSEIQEVIDYVKTTQPNLQGEALAEEILAELTGRRGVELLEKHGDKKSGIIAWLKEALEAIKQMLGLSQMSNEQAMNLTLQEYADA